MTGSRILLAAGSALLASAALRAQAPEEKTSPLAPDSDFIQAATGHELGTIQLSDVAAQKASTSMVKDFAKRIAAEHRRISDELASIANQEGLKAAASMNAESKATYEVLSGMADVQLDQTYVRVMIREFSGELDAFKKEADAGKNPKIRAFASAKLPVLKEDLKLARDTASGLGLTVETTGP